MHMIRKAARGIHRRSVWQVVFVYAALGWGLVALANRLTTDAGLPSWTPTMALILLLALFPLVVATAVVQGGLPGLRIVDAVDPNELIGRTPAEVHVIPEAHPLYGVGLLTWRNTVLVAITAAALLVGSVAAYLAMWALGIGPVGSLMAQGAIAEGDPIAVATFANRTDDVSLGALISDVLELDLTQSSVVIVTRTAGASPSARLVVEGEVSPVVEGYTITARVVLAETGAHLARFEQHLPGDGEPLAAIERLSERIREKLGESLRSVRGPDRLAGLKTDSTEALRLYGLAHQAAARGDGRSAVQLLEQALAVDGGFAMAWRTLGALQDQLADTVGAVNAYRRVVDSWAGGQVGWRTVRELRERIDALRS